MTDHPIGSGSGGRPGGLVPKASDVLSEQLRDLIVGQGLAPGDPMPSEAELISGYGYSRGTVREALRLLEVEGLIVVKRGPKGGVRVSHPDIRQVSRSLGLLFSVRQTSLGDLFAFRKLLEPAAAAEAARTATDAQKNMLVELAAQDVDGPAPLTDSARFHAAIGECSNNGVYEVLLGMVHDGLDWHAPPEVLGEADLRAAQRAHIAIADAVARGDEALAARRMVSHLDAAQGRLDQPIVPLTRWRRERT